jgi:multidrug efflux pump subunit AcrA (membrane-fusion protein)
MTSQDAPSVAERRGHSPRHWLLFLFLVAIAAALVFFVGWAPRQKERADIDKQARERSEAQPKVEVIRVENASAAGNLTIPGTTLAYTQASLYARASGYVTRRLVDIGDRVHKGQLLAIIDSPDLDQQVAQARSTLAQSQSTTGQLAAQLRLTQLTWDRYRVLVAKGVFSRQEGDTREADLHVAEANLNAGNNTVQANRDNLQRLIVLQQYERVTAPFAGVITSRNIDVGSLISAQGTGQGASATASPGSTQSAAQATNAGASGNLASSVAPPTGGSQGGEMFAIATLDPLRVVVSVPETYASLIRLRQTAHLSFQLNPQEQVPGIVTRTSSSIDQNTRTLLVELQVRNPQGRILPGMYVVVDFSGFQNSPSLLIPGEAIVIRNGQTMVAVIDNNRVHFTRVKLGRDYGEQTEVTSGLRPGDVIARTISDQVQDNAEVEPQFQPAKQNQKGGAPKGASK